MTQQPPGPPQWQPPTHYTVRTGLPGWLHVVYFFAGLLTCGLGWIPWAIHWLAVQSKTTIDRR